MSAHTPGPWRWELNEKSKQLQLCGGRSPFDLTVIDFERWGMGGAVARFRTGGAGLNIMKHARDFAVVVPGREHHADWFKGLEHPDATLIEASPDLLSVVEAVISTDATRLANPVDGKWAQTVTPGEWLRLVGIAQAAIAKARGGQ